MEALDNLVKEIQLIVLKELNPTIGSSRGEGAVPYLLIINSINKHFGTNYQSQKLSQVKLRPIEGFEGLKTFDGIYEKLPLKD